MMNTKDALFEYCLRLGDNAVVLAQRLAEWSGSAPVLEEDIAMSNMSLDLIGHARGFLTYAAETEAKGRTEDDLAFFRDVRDYRNRNLLEQPNGDFAFTMMRSFLYSAFAYLHIRELMKSKDETISGIAGKAIKELTYHLRHTSQWIIRLGDGTEESHQRAQNSLNDLWSYTDELFEMNNVDEALIAEGIACDLNKLRAEWDKITDDVLTNATLTKPEGQVYQSKGGINGVHGEHLGFLLSEMQSLPRMYPDAKW